MRPNTERNRVDVKLSPQLRRFIELVFAGASKTAAWCEATGCKPGPTARAKASRAWKGKAAQAYVAELESRTARGEVAGGHEAMVITSAEVERRARLIGASVISREAELAWLVGVIFVGANELLDSNLNVRPGFGPLVQSYERAPGPFGERIKVTMPPKLPALRMLAEMVGHIKPEESGEDLGALVRSLIKPTVGLNGEPVNVASLEAQNAMLSNRIETTS
jgi:hypothetical protein